MLELIGPEAVRKLVLRQVGPQIEQAAGILRKAIEAGMPNDHIASEINDFTEGAVRVLKDRGFPASIVQIALDAMKEMLWREVQRPAGPRHLADRR